MLSREGKQTDRGAVGAEFIGYNRRRREALLLQEFPHQPNCRPSVPAGLNQEIQDFALTVHGTPEIELPPSNYDDHLVQVPAFGRSWPPTLNPPRIGPTEFQDPSSNCFIRDVETTLGKQVLNVPIAQRETAIEPGGMLDDDRWKAVTTVGYLAHPETLKHRPCRSHAVNVTMPAGTIAAKLHLQMVGSPPPPPPPIVPPSDGIGLQAAAGRKPVTMRAVPSHDQLADKVSKWEVSALQSRDHSPARAVALVRGRRDRYSGMGGLVQQPAAPGAHRKHPAGRSRGTPLRHAGAVRHGGVTQTKWPPPNPARFRQLKGNTP